MWHRGASGSPSPFFEEIDDARVTYVYDDETYSTLGTKRNRLARLARGGVLANFDDDDVYRPEYLSRMVSALLPTGTAVEEPRLAKLYAFVCYNVNTGVLLEENCANEGHDSDGPRFLGDTASRWWGYGFSYCYTRAFLDLAPFGDITFAEDYKFVCDGAAAGGDCEAFADDASDPIVLHVLHRGSTAGIVASRSLASGADVPAQEAIKRLTGIAPIEVKHAKEALAQRTRRRVERRRLRRRARGSDSDVSGYSSSSSSSDGAPPSQPAS